MSAPPHPASAVPPACGTPGETPAAPMARVCAWCKRVWSASGWADADPRPPSPPSPPVTHGICADCLAGMGFPEGGFAPDDRVARAG